MPIISIFSGTFCTEEVLTDNLSQQSGYTVIRDQNFVQTASNLSKMSVSKIQKIFTGKHSIFNKFTHERERSSVYLKLALADALSKEDLIIEGFGAHLIPREITQVLRVCLIADIKFRISIAEKKLKISSLEAKELIQSQDHDRSVWVYSLCQSNDPWAPNLYDIVFPTDKMDQEKIIQLILHNVKKDIFQKDEGFQKALDDYRLSAAVELELVRKGHNVSVKADNGNIILTINKHVLLLNHLEEELKSIINRLPGVKNIEIKVGPEFYQADIYRKANFEMPSKILLVDDEREFVQTLSERLLIRDMGSAVAYDGESALKMIRDDEPEVMILDLRMPGIDGIEVLKRVKKLNPDIEVIILTGHGSEDDKEICMKLGAFAYLQKPVDIDALSEAIKQANDRIRSLHGTTKKFS